MSNCLTVSGTFLDAPRWIFMYHMREVAAGCCRSASDTEAWIVFVISNYMISTLIPKPRPTVMKKYFSKWQLSTKEDLTDYLAVTGLGQMVIEGTILRYFSSSGMMDAGDTLWRQLHQWKWGLEEAVKIKTFRFYSLWRLEVCYLLLRRR